MQLGETAHMANVYRPTRLLHFSFRIQPVVHASKHKQIDWMLTARKSRTLKRTSTRDIKCHRIRGHRNVQEPIGHISKIGH